MQKITFTINEDEIREVAERDLSDEQVKLVLDMVECDEMLGKDIRAAILGAIAELNYL
jgi:hypothetical protein